VGAAAGARRGVGEPLDLVGQLVADERQGVVAHTRVEESEKNDHGLTLDRRSRHRYVSASRPDLLGPQQAKFLLIKGHFVYQRTDTPTGSWRARVSGCLGSHSYHKLRYDFMTGDSWDPTQLKDLHPEGDVFLMTRFHGADLAAYAEFVQVLNEELNGYGLRLIRADYKQFRDELWSNVCHHMENAEFGIAVFDCFDDLPPSLNVSLELGYMLAKGKRCLLLRDVRLPALQADLAGHICHEIDQRDISGTVRGCVRDWLRDLGVAKRPGERLVIFVSYGGTCRDPMAKAILEQIMERRPPPFPLRVEARGLYPHRKSASIAARKAIAEAYGSDLLASHRPQR
jgi:hypothetical protein